MRTIHRKPELNWRDISEHLARGMRLGGFLYPLYERDSEYEDEALDFGFNFIGGHTDKRHPTEYWATDSEGDPTPRYSYTPLSAEESEGES